MTPNEYVEKITIGEATVIVRRASSPTDGVDIVDGAGLFRLVAAFDDALRPDNYDKPDGAPMRLFTGDTVRVDLSKRSREDMGFWHRSADFNEIIVCLKGALHWETELGAVTLHPGEMIWIPRGVAHRSMLCDESAEENVLLELKIAEDLTFVAGGEGV